jgi:hypothetical protein
MHKQRTAGLTFVFVILMLAALACTCGPLSQVQDAAATGQAAATQIGDFSGTASEFIDEATRLAPTFNAQMTEIVMTANAAGEDIGPELTAAVMTATALGASTGGSAEGTPLPTAAQEGNTVTQWASGATASSEYREVSWAAFQAAGEPDTVGCGDIETSWASGTSTEVAQLTLSYAVPVIPTQINIYETYNPDQVSLVEVVEPNGTRHTVYEGQPQLLDAPACPYILTINVSDLTVLISQVIVTVDQTATSAWNEIDAVQLIGTVQ